MRIIDRRGIRMSIEIQGKLEFTFNDEETPWRNQYVCFSHAVTRIIIKGQSIESEIKLYTGKPESSYYEEREKDCVDCAYRVPLGVKVS